MANATKKALMTALIELLNGTTLDNITVKDIVERADVSRQTFYYHFGDVYELLEWAFQEQLKHLNELPANNWDERILIAIDYLRTNRTLAMNVYHSLGAEYLSLGLERAVRPFVEASLNHVAGSIPMQQRDKEFAVSFFTYGVIGSIMKWLDDGMPEELDHIIMDVGRLLRAGVLEYGGANKKETSF